VRTSLPTERSSITRTFHLGDSGAFHVTVGLKEDGTAGELFLWDRKMGSSDHGLFDAVLTSISIGLQHGVPLREYLAKLRWLKFDPSGFTGSAEFPTATSKLDLVAQWLMRIFPESEESTTDEVWGK